ncbi:hypothetical protein PM8797T_21083 [Gimesia maris DSM 8797]|nr:hypothetical protein PM8797T_21083 [Gimesia maris DSM 8797]
MRSAHSAVLVPLNMRYRQGI